MIIAYGAYDSRNGLCAAAVLGMSRGCSCTQSLALHYSSLACDKIICDHDYDHSSIVA